MAQVRGEIVSFVKGDVKGVVWWRELVRFGVLRGEVNVTLKTYHINMICISIYTLPLWTT